MFELLKKVYAFAKKNLLPLVISIVALYFVRFIVYVLRQASWGGGAFYIIEDLFFTILMLGAYGVGVFALIKKNEKLFKAFFVIVFSSVFFGAISGAFSFIRYFSGYGAVSVISAIINSLCSVAILFVGVLTTMNYVKGEKKYGDYIDVAVGAYVVLKVLVFLILFVANIVNKSFGTDNVFPIINIMQAFLFIAIYDDVSGRLDKTEEKKETVSETTEPDNSAQESEGETKKESAEEN